MGTVRRERVLAVAPGDAEARWSDPRRWEGWVDGLRRVEALAEEWPAANATVRWRSGPAGRGSVCERVIAHEPARKLEVSFEDDRMQGIQTAEFASCAAGSRLALSFRYTVKGAGPVGALIDLVFVRRVVGEMLERTLDSFAAELGDPSR